MALKAADGGYPRRYMISISNNKRCSQQRSHGVEEEHQPAESSHPGERLQGGVVGQNCLAGATRDMVESLKQEEEQYQGVHHTFSDQELNVRLVIDQSSPLRT
jgi:hypothetical protein